MPIFGNEAARSDLTILVATHQSVYLNYRRSTSKFAKMAPLPLGFIPAAIALVLWSCAPWQCLLAAYVSDNNDALLSEQRSILTAFKQEIVGDPEGALASWRASRDVCSWRGVACAAGGAGNSTVVGLELPGEGLNGTLTPRLFSMPFLTYLNLSSNSFKGSFPEVRNGSSLVSLDLSSNLLSGTLPESIGTLSSLEVLSLGSNDFWGPIPSALGRCNKLAYLELGMASDGQSPSVLNGTIPDTLANCSSLTLLRLSYAKLTGPIPAWLGSLKELKVLDLASNRSGTIPPSLGNLTGLAVLSLMDNADLQGEVPAELKLCSNLMSLSLGMTDALSDDRNEINGTLESLYSVVLSNMTFLQRLVVSGTQVAGVIPQELGTGLKGLVHLDLWANFLEGEVPRTLGNLTNLEYVDLTNNDFRGSIPRELGFCTRLQEFQVGVSSDLGLTAPNGGGAYVRNMMVGSIPQELWRLPFFRIFWVSYTGIGGEIPDFTNSSALVDVDLSYNELEGSIPTHLPPSLEYFQVLFNRLIGPIPRAIGNLSNLVYLDIRYNDIEGAIPSEIASCKKLQVLQLGGSSISHGPRRSMITGFIPEELGQLTDLLYFTVESTQVSGMIPASLGNCSSIIDLTLDDNDLSGGLPTWLANMTSLKGFSGSSNRFQGLLSAVEWNRLQSLQILVLSRNNFSGYLPASLGMASKLAIFIASEANLVGTIPLSFRNCSTLSLVDLQNNQLSGDISEALDVLSDTADGRSIRAIMLSSNKLEGSLPPWMGSRFNSLVILVLAGNLIEGSIPSGLSHLPSLQHVILSDPRNIIFRIEGQMTDPPIVLTMKNVTTGLFGLPTSTTILDLSNNNLLGEIPPEMSNLVGLRYLNLSRNHLTGPIPMTFVNLTSLIQMDLSNNGLDGSIPAVFANLATLDYADFSNNHLVGLIPFGTRFGIPSYLGNPSLCGEILNISCSIAQSTQANLAPNPSYISSRNPNIPWSWPGFSTGCVTSFLTVMGLFLSTTRGLYYIFGDTEPSIYLVKHGFYNAP